MAKPPLEPADLKAQAQAQAQVFYRLMTPCVMKFFQCVCDVKSKGSNR